MRSHIAIPQSARTSGEEIIEDQDEPLPTPKSVSPPVNKSKISCIIIFAFLTAVTTSLYYFIRYGKSYAILEQTVTKHSNELFIVKELPHDKNCYTQGLSFINKTHILQSCGLYGQSYFHILEYDLEKHVNELTEVYRSPVFDQALFIQGSVFFPKNGLYYFLTWRENTVLRYYEQQGQFVRKDSLRWNHPGWGLTHNNTHLIMSQGSHKLYVTTEDLKVVRTIEVLDQDKREVSELNELEYVEEEGIPYVYANIYLSADHVIVKIDFRSGVVVASYKLGKVAAKEPQAVRNDQVLNGIAYRESSKQFLITGKHWKSLYLIEQF